MILSILTETAADIEIGFPKKIALDGVWTQESDPTA